MIVRAIGAGLVGVLALALAVVLAGTGYQEHAVQAVKAAAATPERARITRALADKVPKGPFIVIDQARNHLEVRRGGQVLLEAVCSSGSGMVLREDGGQGRQWVFDTPRGQYAVKSKLKNPVWRKPDWAFIEEGVEPPADPGDRIEYGALGEYALYFGNGYMIHGTLYERLLGRSVTHGCIRLGRDNLAAVYRLCPVGTPIYIF